MQSGVGEGLVLTRPHPCVRGRVVQGPVRLVRLSQLVAALALLSGAVLSCLARSVRPKPSHVYAGLARASVGCIDAARWQWTPGE